MSVSVVPHISASFACMGLHTPGGADVTNMYVSHTSRNNSCSYLGSKVDNAIRVFYDCSRLRDQRQTSA